MGAVVLVVLLPSTREALYGFSFGFQGYRLGPEGAEILAWDGSETAVRVLVRALNTLDPEADSARADAFLAAAGQLAGRPFDRRADWPATTAEVNRWAAERLGRPLDPGGGVWSWFPPSGRVGNWIDDIATSEPDWSTHYWSVFGLGTFHNPEAFLWEVGNGFADPRPLPFALVLEPEYPGSATTVLRALPEPIEGCGCEPLAFTVGESLRVQAWDLLAPPDVPFEEWWGAFARLHGLPAPLNEPRQLERSPSSASHNTLKLREEPSTRISRWSTRTRGGPYEGAPALTKGSPRPK